MTAQDFLKTKGFYNTKGVINIHDQWHDITEMLQEYSQLQNKELAERVKELEAQVIYYKEQLGWE